MTDARLLREPVEGALFLSQNYIESGNDHKEREPIFITSGIYCRFELYTVVEIYTPADPCNYPK